MDSPLSEVNAIQNAFTRYGVTVADANRAAERVLRLLYANEWFGRPEVEIRHASDWKGENL